MESILPQDKSNGYEEAAEVFMSSRNPCIGAATVREWSQTLAPGSSILDLGCGNGVPISQVLIEVGLTVYGVDASAKLIAAFRKRFPHAHAECSAVEDSEFFRRTFDGVVAWGLMFLLPADVQGAVIRKVAGALNSGRQVSVYVTKRSGRVARRADRTRVDFAGSRGIPNKLCAPRAWFWLANSSTKGAITTISSRSSERSREPTAQL